MQVAVLGQGARAAAHHAWYAQTGVTVLPAVASPADEMPSADLYHLCDEGPGRRRLLGVLLRRRRVAVLVAGPLSADPAEALRLARLAVRRRSALAVTGGWRWVPAFARLRELVAGGILGVVRRVEVSVQAASGGDGEERWGALDLGWWLAGAGAIAADAAERAAGRFHAGAAEVLARVATGNQGGPPTWTVAIEADLGQAAAEAAFAPWLPGQVCRLQAVSVALAGRRRELAAPEADPVASELAAVLARQQAGLPWLGVCLAEQAAVLSGLVAAGGNRDAAGKSLPCG